ncbi:MAG: hypothetical protein EBS19_04660, partial [Spirochaetia bacterium]|nr:hypothetical protein [Spirochaetia bacterium]
DLFMERVKEKNGKWSLFCPHECPGLSDVYGEEFKTLSEQLVETNKQIAIKNTIVNGFKDLIKELEIEIAGLQMKHIDGFDNTKELNDLTEQSKNSEKLFLLSGSPRTFQKFTKRFRGYVGGIPHSTSPSLLMLPANKTPFRGLFQGGDTAFPGQGTPAVVKGAYQILNYSKYLD